MIVSIYRAKAKPGAYLYLPKTSKPEQLPSELLAVLGRLEHVFSFLLTPERQLQRADSQEVLKYLQTQGYYLQMPPAKDPDAWDPKQVPDAN